MRSAVNQAANAANTAGNVAAGYGANASTISSQLVPFETRQLTNPAGYSQQDIGAMLTQGLAGAGGATSGIQGLAGKMGMTTRNPMGFSAALDAASRNRAKAAAGVGEGIAARNAGVKLQQQNEAANTLGRLYGTDVGAQAENLRNQTGDINAQTNASNSGWFQNLTGMMKALR